MTTSRFWVWLLGLSLPVTAAAQEPARPTFDGTRASGQVETLICNDPGVIALDRRMADVLGAALKRLPPEKASFRAFRASSTPMRAHGGYAVHVAEGMSVEDTRR